MNRIETSGVLLLLLLFSVKNGCILASYINLVKELLKNYDLEYTSRKHAYIILIP